MTPDFGFRGYISSRPFCGERAPQHVQNLVIRTYCARNDLRYLLSATELAIPDSFLMLEQLLGQIDTLDGIVCYSLKQLPEEQDKRRQIFSRVIDAGRSIHFAMEGLRVVVTEDAERVENIFQVQTLIPYCLSAEDLRMAVGGARN